MGTIAFEPVRLRARVWTRTCRRRADEDARVKTRGWMHAARCVSCVGEAVSSRRESRRGRGVIRADGRARARGTRASARRASGPSTGEVVVLTTLLAWCAYAKNDRDSRARMREGEGRRRGKGATSDARAETRAGGRDAASADAPFDPMMRVEVKKVADERNSGRLSQEREAAAAKKRREEERIKKEEEVAKAKRDTEEAAAKLAKGKEREKELEAKAKAKGEVVTAPTYRRFVAERSAEAERGWKPIRNEAAEELRSVIQARRAERRDRIIELTKLKKEQARAAEAEAQLRAALERERRAEEAAQKLLREREANLARAQERAEQAAREEAQARAKQLEADVRAAEKAAIERERIAREQIEIQAKEAARQARLLEERERTLQAEKMKTAKEAEALKVKMAKEAEAARAQATKEAEAAKTKAVKEAEAAKTKAAKEAEAARAQAAKEAESRAARMRKEADSQRRAEYIDDLKYQVADALDSAVDGVINGVSGVRQFFVRTSSRVTGTLAQKTAKTQAPKPKPDVKRFAPSAKGQSKQAKSWSLPAPKMPRLPSAVGVSLNAGGYAGLGFATSIVAASVLSVGVRASRRNRARRRAERQARLESDKLRQKDRWAFAIDTDIVSREVAERAERIAEARAAEDNDGTDAENRASLQRAYDEFLKASAADKKM